jgi:hypothetical protein
MGNGFDGWEPCEYDQECDDYPPAVKECRSINTLKFCELLGLPNDDIEVG